MRRVTIVYELICSVVRPGVAPGFVVGDLYDKSSWEVSWSIEKPPTDEERAAVKLAIDRFDVTKEYPVLPITAPMSDEMYVVIAIARSIIAKGLMTIEDFSPEVRDLLSQENAR